MSSDTAIKVNNLSKCYHIYETPRDRLKQFFMPRLQRLMGREPRRYFREFWALNDVSFEVRRGETVGIIGRNGSGKSTLLQIVCGTLAATSGTVATIGRIAALLELGSGFNPEFTGRENVYMNGAVLGLSKEELDSRYDSIVAFADIGAFIEQPVKTYSSGMVVRLAFAVAINVDPKILVVDEALAVGDELFQRKCFSRIQTIKENGATVLFVSHSGAQIIELCDRAVLIDAGTKLAEGAPKSIVGKYQKLLYAPENKREEIRAEIQSTAHSTVQLVPYQNSATFVTRSEAPDNANTTEEFFDPNLIPQSTITYESHGAMIERPQIFTLAGERVNCLKRGHTYRYTYVVIFAEAAFNVRFGMLIKTLSGIELGGATSGTALQEGGAYIAAGSTVRVEFRFQCNLNPGTYFLNAGVTGIRNLDEIYLHRVLDAYMFRVLPSVDNSHHPTGFVDFNCTPEVVFFDHNPTVPAVR